MFVERGRDHRYRTYIYALDIGVRKAAEGGEESLEVAKAGADEDVRRYFPEHQCSDQCRGWMREA